MSDLISKSEILELLYKIFDKYYMSTDKNPSIISKSFGTESFGIDVFKEIKKMPTAYDIDKVVEEIKTLKEEALGEYNMGEYNLDNNDIDMEEVITLKQLSNVQNWIGKGVRIAFCLDEDSSVVYKIDIVNFKQIKEQIFNLEKFRVFRIDSLDDLICVYVIEIAEKGVEVDERNVF